MLLLDEFKAARGELNLLQRQKSIEFASSSCTYVSWAAPNGRNDSKDCTTSLVFILQTRTPGIRGRHTDPLRNVCLERQNVV